MTDRKDINMASGKRPGCIVLVVVALILGVPPYALAAAQTISGYVQYPDLRRSVRVTVTLRDQEGHRVASTVTNEAGAFVLVAPQRAPSPCKPVRQSLRAPPSCWPSATPPLNRSC